jgi:hypothetical protein
MRQAGGLRVAPRVGTYSFKVIASLEASDVSIIVRRLRLHMRYSFLDIYTLARPDDADDADSQDAHTTQDEVLRCGESACNWPSVDVGSGLVSRGARKIDVMSDVSVSVDNDHLDKIDEVAAELRSKGMQVDQVLSEVGVISGSVPDDLRQALETGSGVEGVEEAKSFQIPPPESDIQ